MRKLLAALAGCLLLTAAPGRGQQGGAPPPSAAPPAAPAFQFENPALPARQKELLMHYAQAVSRWALVQRIVQGVTKAQQSGQMSMERVKAIDEAWQRGEDPEGLATALGSNDCAQALQTLISANPGYAEAFVADNRGALVCMSQRTSDYWQGDEAKWARSYADGAGAVFISNTEHDDSTGLDVIHISVPVRAAGRVVGVLVVGRMIAPG